MSALLGMSIETRDTILSRVDDMKDTLELIEQRLNGLRTRQADPPAPACTETHLVGRPQFSQPCTHYTSSGLCAITSHTGNTWLAVRGHRGDWACDRHLVVTFQDMLDLATMLDLALEVYFVPA